jgi:hypothetical protein
MREGALMLGVSLVTGSASLRGTHPAWGTECGPRMGSAL